MLAGSLGVLVLVLALLAARKRRYGIAQIARRRRCWWRSRSRCTCAANTRRRRRWRSLGEAILLFAALRWSNTDLARVGALTLAVIIFQALLGMWTVTWLLKPIVVMGHLLGGLTTFALLTWMAWRATDRPITLVEAIALQRWVIAGLVLLGAADRARRLDQRQLRGAVVRALVGRRFPEVRGPVVAAARFPRRLRALARHRRGLRRRRARRRLRASRSSWRTASSRSSVALYLLAFGVRLLRTPGMRGWRRR